MKFLSTVGKARRPKFELHLKIYDLNNIPLVSGSSFIKWHLSHSMHAEHRGRTGKCPISNHKVDYGYSKLIPGVRISMEKNNSLTECPMEFEIVQEFAVAEKITLGYVKLNLAEYVEESESFSREAGSPPRKRSSIGASLTPADGGAGPENRIVEEGIVRRYLMSDSKINSTLKIGILMVQVDGERNFVAPALKTAPVFGGITGLVAPEAEDDTSPMPSISKPRDAAEVHDLYRRTLAASWSRQPNELPADECIEDIFSGGNGWGTKKEAHDNHNSDEGEAEPLAGTLRPSDFRRYANHHNSHDGSQGRHSRNKSASSDRSVSTVTGGSGGNGTGGHRRGGRFVNEDGRDARDDDLGSSRSGSMGSLAPTLGSSSDGGRGEPVMRRAREVDEFEVREDLVAWKLPGSVEA
ncbi:estrogen-responsive protein [Metarhizium brunneum]